jgi:hypothetical protein
MNYGRKKEFLWSGRWEVKTGPLFTLYTRAYLPLLALIRRLFFARKRRGMC